MSHTDSDFYILANSFFFAGQLYDVNIQTQGRCPRLCSLTSWIFIHTMYIHYTHYKLLQLTEAELKFSRISLCSDENHVPVEGRTRDTFTGDSGGYRHGPLSTERVETCTQLSVYLLSSARPTSRLLLRLNK